MQCLALPTPDQPKTATDFIAEVSTLSREDREPRFLDYLLEGHVPSRMRAFVPVKVSFVDKTGVSRILEIYVLPDYLQIGTDDDSFIVPLWPLTAQRVADEWECILPTTQMVTTIWQNSTWKVQPQPWGPPYDHSMMSTDRIVAHGARVDATMKSMGVDRTTLVAGHKKDVVITNLLAHKQKNVAIFGWHRTSGQPIQPLYLGHVNTYGDYSHGIRLTLRDCVLDGKPALVEDILRDPDLCSVLSAEGPMTLVRQPLV
jgi:hypothetical protein